MRFTLTEDHIKLLSRTYVEWEYCETGAPSINPKRPYGNSFVPQDVADILEWKYELDDDEDFPEEIESKALKIHKETETALQIILSTKSFIPGVYESTDEICNRTWKLIV